MQKKTFSLLVFHGSPRKNANEAAAEFANALRAEHGCNNFSMCFLKGVAPELHESLESAIASGEKNIRLLPLFLLPGSHTSDDIPGMAAAFSRKHPDVIITIDDCLVNNQDFVKFVANRLKSQ